MEKTSSHLVALVPQKRRWIPVSIVILVERGLDFFGFTSMIVGVILWVLALALAVWWAWPLIRGIRIRNPITLNRQEKLSGLSDGQADANPLGTTESPPPERDTEGLISLTDIRGWREEITGAEPAIESRAYKEMRPHLDREWIRGLESTHTVDARVGN